MAENNIRITVDPKKAQSGLAAIEKSLERLNRSSDRTRKAINRQSAQISRNMRDVRRNVRAVNKEFDRMGRLVRGVAIGAAIREVGRLADEFTVLQNRLKVVTDSNLELVEATEELFKIAQATRTSFRGTVELYTRVSLATKALGTSTKELTTFTKTLNQAIILSGANYREAENGLIQLSQGIASGTLRGDELRSVLEQLPVVADLIATKLGVVRGEIRDLAAQGKISTKVVLDAVLEQSDAINEAFANTVPTIAQSFENLRSAFIQSIGEIDKARGISRSFNNVLKLLAENIDVVIEGVARLALAIGTVLVVGAFGKLFSALTKLNKLTSRTVIGFALTAAIQLFGSEMLNAATSIDVAEEALQEFNKTAKSAVDELKDIQRAAGVLPAGGNILQNFAGIGGDPREREKELKDIQKAYKVYGNAIRIVRNETTDLMSTLAEERRELELTEDQLELNNRVRDIEGKLLEKIRRVTGVDLEKNIQELVALRNLTRARVRAIQIREKEIQLVRDLREPSREFLEIQKRANSLLKRGAISAEEYNRALDETALGGQFKDLEAEFSTSIEKLNTSFDENLKLINDFRKAGGDAARSWELLRKATEKYEEELDKLENPQKAILARLEKEIELLKLSTREREFATKVAAEFAKAEGELSEVSKEQIERTLRLKRARQEERDALEQIRGPLDEFIQANDVYGRLLDKNLITQRQFNQALAGTEFGGQVLAAAEDPFQTITLEEQEAEFQRRLELLEQFQTLRVESTEATLAKIRQLEEANAEQVRKIQQETAFATVALTNNALSVLTASFASFADKQSDTYRALFAVSKGFAAAEAAVNIAAAIAKAANSTTIPERIANIASVVAATSGLISTIQSTSLGFQTGGSFRVGGVGGADSQLVAFRATPNEEVTVRTPSQQKVAAESISRPAAAPQNIKVVVVENMDKAIEEKLSSPSGERVIIQVVEKNQASLAPILNRRRSV